MDRFNFPRLFSSIGPYSDERLLSAPDLTFGDHATLCGHRHVRAIEERATSCNVVQYVFVRAGMKVIEHGILADQWNGLWASDHLPVLAEIEIK
ncbi:MAG: hypothetical protein ABL984_09970 [Pyrinomonadaceae bacterium]